MIGQVERVTTIGDLSVLRRGGAAGTKYVVDLPFDMDVFDDAPTAGPYRTIGEASNAARQLWDLLTSGSD